MFVFQLAYKEVCTAQFTSYINICLRWSGNKWSGHTDCCFHLVFTLVSNASPVTTYDRISRRGSQTTERQGFIHDPTTRLTGLINHKMLKSVYSTNAHAIINKNNTEKKYSSMYSCLVYNLGCLIYKLLYIYKSCLL